MAHDPATPNLGPGAVPSPPAGPAPRPRPRAPMRSIDWTTGRLLNGRYRMVRKLGAGGMGAVYLCDDVLLRRRVALKTLFSNSQLDDEDLDRFRREVSIAHAVNHPNIARTYDLGESAGIHYLTMEFLEGKTLVDRLREGAAMTSTEVREIAIPLCQGLRAAHRAGVVHRDLKPANVMLVNDDRKAVIMDFGIARAGDDDEQHGPRAPLEQNATIPWEVTSAGRGTPTYMAPEQWDDESGDARTDMYALGVILFVCLTRRAPYRAESAEALAMLHKHAPIPDVAALVPGVDRDLAKLIRHCLAKRPQDRPDSAVAVLNELQRGARRRKQVLSLAGISLALAGLLLLTGLGLWMMAKSAVIQEMRPSQARLAEVIALQMDARALDEVNRTKAIDSPAFVRAHRVLERYKESNPELLSLYVMRSTSRDDQYEIVVDLLPKDRDLNGDGVISQDEQGSAPGRRYDGSDTPAMAEVLRTGRAGSDTDFVADDWGLSLSGYSPVVQDGRTTAYFVGVDARNDQLERLRVRLAVLFSVVWLLGTISFTIARLVMDGRAQD
jgi:serine/threonine protein kinase